MSEATGILERSGDVNDRCLVEWVKLYHIVEEAGACLGVENTSTSVASAASAASRLNPIFKTFERQMTKWRQDCDTEVLNGA